MKTNTLVKIRDGRLFLDGQPQQFRGCNLGNFMLMESYMLGLPGTEFQFRAEMRSQLGEERFRAFWDTFMDAYLTPADMVFMKEMGFNLLQLPFNYRHFLRDGTTAGFYEDGYVYVDHVVSLAEKYGMKVLLSLHAAPGCAARDWNAESAHGEVLLWEHDAFMQATADFWQQMAKRYAGNPTVFGYEIINEPVTDKVDVLNAFTRQCLKAIRSVDKEHIVVLNGNRWGRDNACYEDGLFADPQVMTSFHSYTVLQEPFKRLQSFPGEIDNRPFGEPEARAAIDRFLKPGLNRPSLVGEFGIITQKTEFLAGGGSDPKGLATHIPLNRILIDEFEKRGYPWTFWAYKDLGSISLVSPKADTPWQQFFNSEDVQRLTTAYSTLSPKFAATLLERIPECAGEPMDVFIYQSKHHFDTMILTEVVKLLQKYDVAGMKALANSFAFENCSICPHKKALYRVGV